MPSKAPKHVVTEPGMLTQTPPLLAPAASLASVPKPEAFPAPEAPQKKGAIGDPLQEILALKPQEGPPPAEGAAAHGEKPAKTASPRPPAKPLSGAEGEQKTTSPQDGRRPPRAQPQGSRSRPRRGALLRWRCPGRKPGRRRRLVRIRRRTRLPDRRSPKKGLWQLRDQARPRRRRWSRRRGSRTRPNRV